MARTRKRRAEQKQSTPSGWNSAVLVGLMVAVAGAGSSVYSAFLRGTKPPVVVVEPTVMRESLPQTKAVSRDQQLRGPEKAKRMPGRQVEPISPRPVVDRVWHEEASAIPDLTMLASDDESDDSPLDEPTAVPRLQMTESHGFVELSLTFVNGDGPHNIDVPGKGLVGVTAYPKGANGSGDYDYMKTFPALFDRSTLTMVLKLRKALVVDHELRLVPSVNPAAGGKPRWPLLGDFASCDGRSDPGLLIGFRVEDGKVVPYRWEWTKSS